MRSSLERLGRTLALAGALSGAAETGAEAKKSAAEHRAYTRTEVPVVMPEVYGSLSAQERETMADGTTKLLGKFFNIPDVPITPDMRNLPLDTGIVFSYGRLTGNGIREILMKHGELLDQDIQVKFNSHAKKLIAKGLPALPYDQFKTLVQQAYEKSPEDLKQVYDTLAAALQGRVPSAEHSIASSTSTKTNIRSFSTTRPAEQVVPVPVKKTEPTLKATSITADTGLQQPTESLAKPNEHMRIPQEFAHYISRGPDQREKLFPGHFYHRGKTKEVRINGKDYSTIALTFDDGPDKENTPKILDILKKYGIKATFYVQGMFLTERYREILNRILDEGHEIGLHSLDHTPLTTNRNSLDQIYAKQCTETEERLRELTKTKPEKNDSRKDGYATKLYRPAYGAITRDQIGEFSKPGHDKKIILWSVDTEDRGSQTSEFMSRLVGDGAQAGDIVLMHSAAGKGHGMTPEALPAMIDKLQKRGFAFMTTSEIIAEPSAAAK